MPQYFRALLAPLANASPDDTVMLPSMIWREVSINDGDLHLARSSYEQLWPGPYRQLVEPLNLQKLYSLAKPRGCLIGSDDVALRRVNRVGITGC